MSTEITLTLDGVRHFTITLSPGLEGQRDGIEEGVERYRDW
jgi:hypothetical protein